jgi:hypothetical protein
MRDFRTKAAADLRNAKHRAYAAQGPTPTPDADTAAAGHGDDYGAYARRNAHTGGPAERVSPRASPRPTAANARPAPARPAGAPKEKAKPNVGGGERPLYPASGAAAAAAASAASAAAAAAAAASAAGGAGGAHYGRGKPPPASMRDDMVPPKPLGLRCTAVVPMDAPSNPTAGTGAPGETFSEVGLQWVAPPNTAVELSWRRTPMGVDTHGVRKVTSSWESAKTMVKGGRCVKKNLIEDSIYEFRVRYTHTLTHSPTHSLTHSLTYSLTH